MAVPGFHELPAAKIAGAPSGPRRISREVVKLQIERPARIERVANAPEQRIVLLKALRSHPISESVEVAQVLPHRVLDLLELIGGQIAAVHRQGLRGGRA
jgi:hypothetical protein